MQQTKEDNKKDIPSHGIFPEGTDTPNGTNERIQKSGSRRTRRRRVQKQNWILPPRQDPTQTEREMLTRLEELTDATGGIGSEERVWTVVMIMTEDRRPIIHDRLLKMMGQSSVGILKKLLGLHQFLLILERWLEMYAKSDAWGDVTERLLEVIGKLPLNRGDEHNFRVTIKRFLSHGVDEKIDRSMQSLLHRWEERRKEQEAAGNLPIPNALSQLHCWTKKKAGKAYVATDPNIKPSKATAKRKFMAHRSSSVGTPPAFSQRRSSFQSNNLTPEAMDVLRRLRMKKALDASKESMPTALIHTMESAPSSPTFYLHQRALYDDLRGDKELPVNRGDMTTEISWKTPPMCKLPPGDIVRANSEMIERLTQDEREKIFPASDSGLLFSSLLESVTSEHHKPVFEFPFFPRNREQYEQQKKLCTDAGVMHGSVLGMETKQTESSTVGSSLLRSYSADPMTQMHS